MERASASSSRSAVIAVAAALLALCCAAARPLGPHEAATSSALALPPAAGQRRAAGYGEVAARAGKWLPFAGGGGFFPHHHLPSAFWAHKPMPWAGFGAAGAQHGGSGAFEGGGGEEEEELVRERERERSYERGESEATTSRREELALWASLLNPKARKRREEANGWLPAAPGIGEAADEEPAAKTADGVVEGAELSDPAAGGVQTRSGFYWGNNGN